MIALSDAQLDTIVSLARRLEPEKRDSYLQRIAADLAVRHGFRFTDADVSAAAHAALQGLVHEPAA
jgi:hypothetical protein